jgi:hypothetical protein
LPKSVNFTFSYSSNSHTERWRICVSNSIVYPVRLSKSYSRESVPHFGILSRHSLNKVPSRSDPFLLRDDQFSPEDPTFCLPIGLLIGSACIVPSGLLFERCCMFFLGAPICLLYSSFSDRFVDSPFIEYHTMRKVLFSQSIPLAILGSFFSDGMASNHTVYVIGMLCTFGFRELERGSFNDENRPVVESPTEQSNSRNHVINNSFGY